MINQKQTTEGKHGRRQSSRPFCNTENLVGQRNQPVEKHGFIQNRQEVLVGCHPIIQQKNFPGLLRVSSFVGFEEVRATEIHQKNGYANEAKKAGQVMVYGVVI